MKHLQKAFTGPISEPLTTRRRKTTTHATVKLFVLHANAARNWSTLNRSCTEPTSYLRVNQNKESKYVLK